MVQTRRSKPCSAWEIKSHLCHVTYFNVLSLTPKVVNNFCVKHFTLENEALNGANLKKLLYWKSGRYSSDKKPFTEKVQFLSYVTIGVIMAGLFVCHVCLLELGDSAGPLDPPQILVHSWVKENLPAEPNIWFERALRWSGDPPWVYSTLAPLWRR